MKLLATTTNKLEQVQKDMAATEGRLAELAIHREEVLAGDAAVDGVLAIDHQAEKEQRKLLLLQSKLAILSERQAVEARNAAAARRVQAIKTVEAMLPGRLEIIRKIESAVQSLPTLFDALDKWQRDFVRKYPADDVELPYQHFLSDERVLRNVKAALHQIRIADAGDQVTGLAEAEAEAEAEAQQHADLIADLKGSPQSEPESEAA